MTNVIAHRGASEAERENSLEAFHAARVMGAQGVELDVRRTADDVLVVHHDAVIKDGPVIREITQSELPAYIPTLIEVFEACEGMSINVEIKNEPDDPDYDEENLISAAVAGLSVAFRPYDELLVTSFNIDAINRIRETDPLIPTGLITWHWIGPEMVIERIVELGHGTLNPWDPLVDEKLVAKCRDAGLALNVWTVNDPERIKELAAMGVDGIITDVPDLALEALAG